MRMCDLSECKFGEECKCLKCEELKINNCNLCYLHGCKQYHQISKEKDNKTIKIKYKNWRNEIGIRTIIPRNIFFGRTEYHPEYQWLMDVWDVDKNALRIYAMMDIIEFIKE